MHNLMQTNGATARKRAMQEDTNKATTRQSPYRSRLLREQGALRPHMLTTEDLFTKGRQVGNRAASSPRAFILR